MANKQGHRSFGNVRKLPSGRWQARYPGPDGQIRNAPRTFESKRAAEQWLSITESKLLSGDWTDPERGKVKLVDYAEKWISERAGLRPRTVELYRWLLRKHVAPGLGGVSLGKLTTALIREWRAALLQAGVSESITAKSYRLLRAILNTAVDEDKIIPRNPCRVRGADRENPAERPTLTVAQVYDLAGRMPERFRVLILLTAFASLRWGEVTALRRCDVADDGSWVKISFAHTEVAGCGVVVGPPKSRAGVRTVLVPNVIRPDVVAHLAEFTGPGVTALVFTGDKGAVLRRGNFNQRVKWVDTVKAMGVAGLHFHDLRHAGNIWAAQTRVSTRDLMARMGHDDMRAALLYQRATSEAAERIATGIDELVSKTRKARKADKPRKRRSGEDDPGPSGLMAR
jgi:integrase